MLFLQTDLYVSVAHLIAAVILLPVPGSVIVGGDLRSLAGLERLGLSLDPQVRADLVRFGQAVIEKRIVNRAIRPINRLILPPCILPSAKMPCYDPGCTYWPAFLIL